MTSPSQRRPPVAGASRTRIASGLVVAARPGQWIKNLACLAGLVFSERLFDAAAAWAVAGFCLASSAVYLVNDVFDRRSDAANPKKRSRPIASGLVPVALALAASAALATAAVGSSLRLTSGPGDEPGLLDPAVTRLFLPDDGLDRGILRGRVSLSRP